MCAFSEYKLTGKNEESLTPHCRRIVINDFTINVVNVRTVAIKVYTG